MNLRRQFLLFVALAFTPCTWATQSASSTTSALRILTENWPPVSYEENGKAQGMAVELVQTIQRNIGQQSTSAKDANNANATGVRAVAAKEAPIEVVPWARGYKFLLDVPNTLLFTVIRTPEREKLFTMLGPVARGNISIFSLANPKNKFEHDQAMKEKAVVAATRGTAFETAAKGMKYKNIIDVKDTETAVRLLASGRVDLICDDSLTIHDILRKLKMDSADFKVVSDVENYDLYLGFSPGTSPEVVRTWKKSLETLKKNGQYAAIYRKWFRNLKPPSTVEVIGIAATSSPR